MEAPAGEVWEALARLEDIRLWSEAVVDAHCDGVSHGVGAVRTCDLRGGITISERWPEWDEGRSFAYEGLGIPLVARATNHWSVQPAGEQTLLVSRAQLVLKGRMFGKLLEPLIRLQIKRVGPRTLAAFKYMVENGQPPTIRHSKPPPASAAC